MVNTTEIFTTEFIRLPQYYLHTNRVCIALHNPAQWGHANETMSTANFPPSPYFEQLVSGEKKAKKTKNLIQTHFLFVLNFSNCDATDYGFWNGWKLDFG